MPDTFMGRLNHFAKIASASRVFKGLTAFKGYIHIKVKSLSLTLYTVENDLIVHLKNL